METTEKACPTCGHCPTCGNASKPVTINMTVLPGGETDAARTVRNALLALHEQTKVSS